MPNAEDDLKATSDAVLADARTLLALEEEKRPIDPSDPHLVAASVEIDRLAGRLQEKTAAERALAHEVTRDTHRRD